ncbi:MAG: hypothetical protein ACD_8C00138G0006 [uncultured bacterium]|nr:MAG: hypothetical protein ACD_8C00138G0006 [uncultured bacterium]
MNPKHLAFVYNNSTPGNQIRKNLLKEIAANMYLIFVEPEGLIRPKHLAQKSLSYSLAQKQLLIKDDKGNVVRKISLGNITKINHEGAVDRIPIMRLIIKS